MPNGVVAPGCIFPPPVVPINTSTCLATEFAVSLVGGAHESQKIASRNIPCFIYQFYLSVNKLTLLAGVSEQAG
jgi:hypothetical protein